MKYLSIFNLYLQEMFTQRLRTVMWFLIGFINSFVILMYWRGALSPGQTVGGWSYDQIQTYYLLLFVMHVLVISHNEIFIGVHDIKNGFLSSHLMKPVSYLFTALCRETPARVIQGIFGVVAILIISLFGFTLSVGFNAEQIPFIVLLIIGGYLISFFMKALLGFIAFWFTETRGFSELYDVLLLVFAGLVVPLDLLPPTFKTIAYATPFPYIVYVPTAALAGRMTSHEMIIAIGTQALICVALYAIYKLTWNSGIKKYTGVGQ